MTWLLIIVVSGYISAVDYTSLQACEAGAKVVMATVYASKAFCIPKD